MRTFVCTKIIKIKPYPNLKFVGTNFENRLIDVLEKLSKNQDNSELEQRLEKLESIIENLSPPTTNSSLRNGINAQFIKKSGKHNYL